MDADISADDFAQDRALTQRALQGHLTSAYQPIVDLSRGVVTGYEALLRYRSDTSSIPFSARQLLASAERVGRVNEMEAAALSVALDAREDLPFDCSLFLIVGAESLADERVERVLGSQGSLDGVVLELKAPRADSLQAAAHAIEMCRDRGARIAVADPFFAPDGLAALSLVQPDFFKLDHDLVSGVSQNNAKLAMVDSVRHLADRLGVGLIAQGIEDLADLRSLERIGVGFGQGYLLARPSIDRRFVRSISSFTGSVGTMHERPLARLIESVCELTEEELDQPITATAGRGLEFEVLVTELREPLALLQRVGRRVASLSLTLLDDNAPVQTAMKVAMRRPAPHRFEPLVLVDEVGACVGVIRVDRLIEAMSQAEHHGRGERAGHSSSRNRFAFDLSCRPPRRPGR